MSVLESDIVIYGSANMQETDSGTQGGAIDNTIRVVFEDIAPSGNMEVVSSAAGDTTQTVTVTGRDAAGNIISEGKTLSGTTPVAMTTETTWERLLKGVKSATTTGDVAAMAVTAEVSDTAQAGAAATASVAANVTLHAGASAVNDFYRGMVFRSLAGTGPNQLRWIIRYDGTTKQAFVNEDWDTVPDATTTFDVAEGFLFGKNAGPAEEMEVRRPFYDVAADVPGGSARDFYEKLFFRNNHATLALTTAVIKENADPSTFIDFWAVGTLDDSGTSTDRTTAPGGSTFDSADDNVANSQSHTAGSGQGVWIHLALAAGEAAQKTTYAMEETGNTT